MSGRKVASVTLPWSRFIALRINGSFTLIERSNLQVDLKEQLKQLTQAVETLAKKLPEEQAAIVADEMERLAREAMWDKPNPERYNISIDGLIATAKNLGKVDDEVIELAGKVRKTLKRKKKIRQSKRSLR